MVQAMIEWFENAEKDRGDMMINIDVEGKRGDPRIDL